MKKLLILFLLLVACGSSSADQVGVGTAPSLPPLYLYQETLTNNYTVTSGLNNITTLASMGSAIIGDTLMICYDIECTKGATPGTLLLNFTNSGASFNFMATGQPGNIQVALIAGQALNLGGCFIGRIVAPGTVTLSASALSGGSNCVGSGPTFGFQAWYIYKQ